MKKLLTVTITVLCMLFISPLALAIDINSSNVTSKNQEVLLTREYLSNATIIEENGYLQIVSDKQLSSNSYQKDTVILIPNAEKTVSEIHNSIDAFINNYTTRGSGSDYFEDWDSSGGLKAWTTVYYSTTTISGVEYLKVTKVTGGLSIVDPTYSITSHKVIIGCTGWSASSGYKEQNTTKTPGLSTFSWSYNAPTSWLYINTEAPIAVAGANYQIKIKRGGSSWNFTLPNLVLEVY